MTRRSRDAPALLTPAEQFEQLYLDCETKLFRYLARRVGPSLAEDLTAEAFAIAWQRFPDYDPTRAAFSTWVFGIALNLLRRHARTELSQLNLFSRTGVDPALPSDENAIVDRLAADAFWPRVAAELAGMDQTDRDVLTIFLTEAAMVGFAGGAAGVGLSLFIQNLVNTALQNTPQEQGGINFLPIDPSQLQGNLFVIPPELIVFAVALATIVGVGAGLLPALRAARMLPVLALKSE